ncbi:hypothetical protein [Streptomyces sp. WMMB303]|uniref:hypothetical protein n=1 Tax=Streptomyces sp. WMMB303 TaxID=3034154 RepID=UPI0023EE1817|nr:hypothetical protein [Streptomyces sp. WMMB303]MDF4254653.1 hypothetical protein [Streptomyces sp. WMMB303]
MPAPADPGSPLSTTTVADWPAAEAFLAQHTSLSAYRLAALAAQMGSEHHELALDPDSRTVWWAWDGSPLDMEGWTVEQLTPEAATDMLETYVIFIEGRREDPSLYTRASEADEDMDAMDEYAAVLRLTLPEDPAEAAREIRHERRRLARRDARWGWTHAELVRGLVGTDRGGKARAARRLRRSEVQIGRIIREDEQRRTAWAEAVPDEPHEESR